MQISFSLSLGLLLCMRNIFAWSQNYDQLTSAFFTDYSRIVVPDKWITNWDLFVEAVLFYSEIARYRKFKFLSLTLK